MNFFFSDSFAVVSEGKLMVAKRQGFHKVYDLTECVLPSTVDTSFPTEKEVAEHLILKQFRHMALLTKMRSPIYEMA